MSEDDFEGDDFRDRDNELYIGDDFEGDDFEGDDFGDRDNELYIGDDFEGDDFGDDFERDDFGDELFDDEVVEKQNSQHSELEDRSDVMSAQDYGRTGAGRRVNAQGVKGIRNAELIFDPRERFVSLIGIVASQFNEKNLLRSEQVDKVIELAGRVSNPGFRNPFAFLAGFINSKDLDLSLDNLIRITEDIHTDAKGETSLRLTKADVIRYRRFISTF